MISPISRVCLSATLLALTACGGNEGAPSTPGSPGPSSSSGSGAPSGQTITKRWSFDEAQTLPPGILVGLGEWKVEADPSAPSGPNVLRQKASLSGAAYPVAYVEGLDLADITVSVRCRPEAGAEDQACGLAFRVKDKDNYLLTRANALEGNIRFYIVQGGVRSEIASATKVVTASSWHTLAATAQGPAITVSWDGEKVLDAQEATRKSGSVGVWTKADSITAFDDLEVTGR